MTVVALKYGGQFEIGIHKVGCSHILRDKRLKMANVIGTYEGVEEVFKDLLDTGDENCPGYFVEEIKIFPCVKE